MTQELRRYKKRMGRNDCLRRQDVCMKTHPFLLIVTLVVFSVTLSLTPPPPLSFMVTVVQEVEKSVSNQKVASLIPCRSVLEQDTEPLIAPDVQCAISVKM